MLRAAGWQTAFGIPRPSEGDAVGVWGRKPVSKRGRWLARKTGAPLITIEDGFLRSVYPGQSRYPPLSLILDDIGIYYDANQPSRLENLLNDGVPGSDMLHRARSAIALLQDQKLSKYTPPASDWAVEPGYVLVIDQTRGDASIPGALADEETFRRMLLAARSENPGQRIVVKSHPEVVMGRKRGHLGRADLNSGEVLVDRAANPWDVIKGARVVYTVSSQIGYEAILGGKRVRTFGAAFYAGWGLSEDEISVARRSVTHTAESLFAACHLTYPLYFDPWQVQICRFEDAVDALNLFRRVESPARECTGDVVSGARLWKRRNIARFLPEHGNPPRFSNTFAAAQEVSRAQKRRMWIWGARPSDAKGIECGCIEDGFIRSIGLGAELNQAASLVLDRSGIYFDPTAHSDLETLISEAADGRADEPRARNLIAAIVSARLSKYNTGDPQTEQTRKGRVILVPGQVEDDASIRLGTSRVRTNLELLRTARDNNPDAWLIYKPHPDVEAGLRTGAIAQDTVTTLADELSLRTSVADLLETVDEVWTMTSLIGFEALLRGLPVTCLGAPFYAGWGLTKDLGDVPARRTAKPTLEQLVWAALIAYPRYVDPVSGLVCRPELVVERFAQGLGPARATWLSKLQALFASQPWIWR
ncbi:MAG: capsular polysaccharide biosynthesis protein [Pseudomonadota bacterium]